MAYLTSLGRDARGDADLSIDIGNRRRPQMIEVDGDTGTVRIVGD